MKISMCSTYREKICRSEWFAERSESVAGGMARDSRSRKRATWASLRWCLHLCSSSSTTPGACKKDILSNNCGLVNRNPAAVRFTACLKTIITNCILHFSFFSDWFSFVCLFPCSRVPLPPPAGVDTFCVNDDINTL